MNKIVSIENQILVNQLVDDYFVCLPTEYGYGICGSLFSPRIPKFDGFSKTSLPYIFFEGVLSMEFFLRDLEVKDEILTLFRTYKDLPLGIKIRLERIGECVITITHSKKLLNLIGKILTPLICFYPIHSNGLPYMNSSNIIDRFPMGFSGCNEFRPLIAFDEIDYKEITIIDIETKTIIREGQVSIEGFPVKKVEYSENKNKYFVAFISDGIDSKQRLIFREKTVLIDFNRQYSNIKEMFLGYYDLSETGDVLEALKNIPKIIEEIDDSKVPFVLFSINMLKDNGQIYHSLLVKRVRELTNDKTIVLPFPLCKL